MSRFLSTGVAIVAMGLVLAACDGTGSSTETPAETTVPSTPTASPTPTPTLTPTPTPTQAAAPSAQELTSLLGEAWNAGFTSDAEPTGDVPEDVAASIMDATIPGSQADEFLTDQAALAFDQEIGLRGDVIVEPLGEVAVDDGTASLEVCASTRLESAAPDVFPGTSGDFLASLVESIAVDGEWRLQRVVPVNEADDVRMSCAPPSLAEPASAAWSEYIPLYDQYWRDPTDEVAAAALSEVSTTTIEPWVEAPFRVERGTPMTEVYAVAASRDSVRIGWCDDPERDPDGLVIDESGEYPFIPTAVVGTWVLAEGEWLSTGEPLRARSTDLEDPVLVQAYRECFS